MTKKMLSKNEKVLFGLLGLSILIMVFGFMFVVNAMGVANFYPHFCAIENSLAKYIIVILTMATGIMLFTNVATRFENKKLRNGLTIGITTFAFVMTVPLTYVLIALLPFAAKYDFAIVDSAIKTAQAAGGTIAEVSAESAKTLGLNAVDSIMGTHSIYWGFCDWFGTSAFLWVVLSFMAILGVVFLVEPLVAGICVTKGKLLQLFGKDEQGKFKFICIVELPVLKKQRCAESEEFGCVHCGCDCCAVVSDIAEEIAE